MNDKQMKDITLLRVQSGFDDVLKIFETIEEFQAFMNEHYRSYWKYEIYNCTLREDNNTPKNQRCW